MLPTNNQEQSAINDNDNLTNQPQTNDNNPSTQSTHVIDSNYKREPDGPILWFSGPPIDIIQDTKAVHSLSYLEWKLNNK